MIRVEPYTNPTESESQWLGLTKPILKNKEKALFFRVLSGLQKNPQNRTEISNIPVSSFL